MSIYLDNFFLAFNIISVMQILKNILEKKYNLKDLFEINIIIK